MAMKLRGAGPAAMSRMGMPPSEPADENNAWFGLDVLDVVCNLCHRRNTGRTCFPCSSAPNLPGAAGRNTARTIGLEQLRDADVVIASGMD